MYMRWEELLPGGFTPTLKNHTTTLVNTSKMYVFGGYDGRRNHNDLHIFDCERMSWQIQSPQPVPVTGNPPSGRNGHTATLAGNNLYIIGGWLGCGPLAANDLYLIDVQTLHWIKPIVTGTLPGPCNMHTADYFEHLNEILLFRGGDGREYLNDIHALELTTMHWRRVIISGKNPIPRANHSSAVVGTDLFIFGGWDGQNRLNDVNILNTMTWTWSELEVPGNLPHPRAGMTLTCVRDRLFVFGGSGPSAKCFNDLNILDPAQCRWLEIVPVEGSLENRSIHDYEALDYNICGDGDANPNDNPHSHQIAIIGNGPGRRAGHTCTVVNRKLFVFGGSYSSDYLNDFFILDTDPCPHATISHSSSTQILQHSLRKFVDSKEFSDISFSVEGRHVYAHKVILSLLSERFRCMFSAGFAETSKSIIELKDIRYEAFVQMIEYLYTGSPPDIILTSPHSNSTTTFTNAGGLLSSSIDRVIDLLALSDQFMLDHLKQICENYLQGVIQVDNVDELLEAADRCNAFQLKAICMHFLRNNNTQP